MFRKSGLGCQQLLSKLWPCDPPGWPGEGQGFRGGWRPPAVNFDLVPGVSIEATSWQMAQFVSSLCPGQY